MARLLQSILLQRLLPILALHATLIVVAPIAAAVAQSLHFVAGPPLTISAGQAFAVEVEARDDDGDPDDDFSPDVQLALLGGATLSGTTAQKVDDDGIADFSDLSIAQPGSYRIVATGGSATPDTSSTVLVLASLTATELEFAQQPTDTQAGETISVTVHALNSVGVVDLTYFGNVSIAIGTNAGGGTLAGTTTVQAVAGVATFSDLSINRSGSGYTLIASAEGLPDETSNGFDVTPGPASGQTTTITANPTSLPADGSSQSVITVEVFDALGNARSEGGDVVQLSTDAGTLGSVNDQGNGTYTAVLTAASSPDVTTVSGFVNGEQIADMATVTFTAVAPTASRLVFGQQPTETQAGATITPAVTVRAVDDTGATDTTFDESITLAIASNPAGGTLSGTTSATAVNGVATFANLSINRSGSGYTLAASSDPLAGVTSSAFSILAGPASPANSTITAAPTSIPANGTSTSTITVEIRDALGNLRPGGDAVALTTSAGTLSPVVDQGNGTYTATLTAPSSAGSATVSGTVNSVTIGDTAVVTFTAFATRLEFGQQPTSTPAGAAISPPVTVRAVDGTGATVGSFTGIVSLTIGANPAGGTLSGNTMVAAVAGVATFSNLSINTPGAGYTLAASASGVTGTTSTAFSITPGSPSGATSTITASPTSVPANGTSTSTITVQLRDAGGNRLTTGGATVTLSTTAGTLGPVTDQGDGTYTATLTAPTAAATATIRGTVSGSAISDTATVTFTMVAPVASRLVFGQQPTDTRAGSQISPAVTVRAVDSGGALVTGYTGNVTIAIGANPAGGSLSGNATVAAVGGVATFSNLSINRAGLGYTLTASASGVNGVTSAFFAITPGPASGGTSLITASPTSVPADGSSSSTITVALRDAAGNPLTAGGATVALSATAGTLGPVVDEGDGTYTAELTAPTAPATAIVSGTVNGGPISDTASVTFTFVPPTVQRLAFGQQPTDTQAGVGITPAPTVRVVDQNGATITTFNGSVTVAIGANPANGMLSGTTTVTAVSGVATFANLSIDRAGSGYRLSAAASGLNSINSAPFAIIPAPASPATSTITAVPTSIPADGSSTTITVDVRDAFGNRRIAGGDAVTLSTSLGTLSAVTDLGNGLYSATLTSSPSAGTATITGRVGGALITDTATVTFTSSTPTPTATRLLFGVQPTSTQAGGVISPAVTVRAVDPGGATVTSFRGSVTIAIGTNPGGGTLSGTTTVTAVSGVATFGNLSIDEAGNGYTLAASASGLIGTASNTFSITSSTAGTTDLAVTASVDDATPAVGDTVVYTIRVTNQGGQAATSVEVSYELDERLVFVSSVPSQGNYNPQLEVWTVGTLDPGEGATLEIEARVQR